MQDKDYKQHYGWHWLFLALCVGLLPLAHRKPLTLTGTPWRQPPPAATARVHWFYIIKFPEITTQHESGVDTMKTRLTEWIKTLKEQGFHPMLLSDVIRSLQNGEGVPEKTIVSLFSPGYRRTYEIVSPILAQNQWPAVWLTDQVGMDHADRRLVTYHTAKKMKDSGLWDVAFQTGDRRFRLESHRNGHFRLGDAQHSFWSPLAGAFALNRGASMADRSFLTVNSAWLAPELLNRLLVEMPPTGDHVYLTKGLIQGREWGITLPSNETHLNPHFDLMAPLNRRGSRLFFLGTQGYPNGRLHIECSRFVGEFWVQLRVDDAAGYGIDVIYADRATYVVQQIQATKKRILFKPHAILKKDKGFIEDITLSGEQLSISLNHEPPITVNGLQPPVTGRGVVQVYIADKPHGTARADSVLITFTPLDHEPE